MSDKKISKSADYPLPEDWRGEVMSRVRKLIHQADPEVIEDVKWKTASNPDGVLVWYHDGMLLTGEIYKKHLRLAFTRGPALKELDTNNLINSYRAIIIKEEDKINEAAFKKLIRAAVELNQRAKKS